MVKETLTIVLSILLKMSGNIEVKWGIELKEWYGSAAIIEVNNMFNKIAKVNI